MADHGVLTGPLESVRIVPGAEWPGPAVIVEGDRAIGLVRQGAIEAAGWDGAPLAGERNLHQLRTEPVEADLELFDVACAEAAPVGRMILRVTFALCGLAPGGGLERLLRAARGAPEHVLERALHEGLERTVRGVLRANELNALRGQAPAVGSRLPAPIGDVFELRSLRLVEEGWETHTAGLQATPFNRGTSFPTWEAAGFSEAVVFPEAPAPPDAAALPEAGLPENSGFAGAGQTPGWNDEWAVLPASADEVRSLNPDLLYARDELLDAAWRRAQLPDEGLRAIGVGRSGDASVVAVLYRNRDELPFGPELLSAFQETAPGARLDVVEAAPTLGETIEGWLADYGLPAGTDTGMRVDPAGPALRVQIAGEQAGRFAASLRAEHAAGLAALNAVLPWTLVVVAEGDAMQAGEPAVGEGEEEA